MHDEREIPRLRRMTMWLTGTLLVVVLAPLFWSWLSQPVGWQWMVAGAVLGLAAVFLLGAVVRAAMTLLTEVRFGSFQELADAIVSQPARGEADTEPSEPQKDLSQPARGEADTEPSQWRKDLLTPLDRETKSLPEVPASSFEEFVEKRRELLAKVKSRSDQEDPREDESLRVQEWRHSLAGERLLAVGNLWLIRGHFRKFVRRLGTVGLLAIFLTVGSVAVVSSAPHRPGGSRAEETNIFTSPTGRPDSPTGIITSPIGVLVFVSDQEQHERLFGSSCPMGGVRGMAVAGSLEIPEVVTYGTRRCQATRIRVDESIGVAVPVSPATSVEAVGSGGVGPTDLGGGSDFSDGSSFESEPRRAGQAISAEGPRVGAVVGMAGGSAGVLAASVLADLTAKAGEEAITTAAQLRQFAIEQVAGPFTKTLSEELARGIADKANSLWGSNRQAKENAVNRARTEVYQSLVIELDVGLSQGTLATVVSEGQRAAIARAVADELADRLAAQMRVRIGVRRSGQVPFPG